MSHLLQMRGLKPVIVEARSHRNCVASFTDAWIETQSAKRRIMQARRRIFYRCVD